MDQESKKLLLEHIASGQYISDAALDVRKMFENAGMGLYAKACCRRIEAAGLVDGIHVFHPQSLPWGLQLDIHGVARCQEILEAYLQPEELKETMEALKVYCEWITSLNNILYLLRNFDSRDLKAERVDKLGFKLVPEEVDDVAELLRAEQKRRRLPGRISHTAARFVFTCHLLALFRGPARALFPLIREAWRSWEDNDSNFYIEGDGPYYKALRRFTDAHGGTDGVDKLNKADLARYIFLAVRARGKESGTEYHRMRIKDCRGVKRRYQEFNGVLKAIGRLTLAELLRLYPVDKVYDGKKLGCKDYFFTMDKLYRMPMDQPIGDACDVACLLWDYQNWDLTDVLLEWMHVLGDLRIYCNEPGPDEAFHEKLLRKEPDTYGKK